MAAHTYSPCSSCLTGNGKKNLQRIRYVKDFRIWQWPWAIAVGITRLRTCFHPGSHVAVSLCTRAGSLTRSQSTALCDWNLFSCLILWYDKNLCLGRVRALLVLSPSTEETSVTLQTPQVTPAVNSSAFLLDGSLHCVGMTRLGLPPSTCTKWFILHYHQYLGAECAQWFIEVELIST